MTNEPPDEREHGFLRGRRAWALLLLAGVIVASFTACSPIYVLRAGIAEAKILAARRPLPEVILDPATDEDTRGKLTLVREARDFAAEGLELDVGDSYTTFTRLERDTLAMVLSAAYRDRLVSKTWWFPIVGSVPYKGYFSQSSAEKAQSSLETEGLDTYLRPTSAFSTLGWFSDPLLSTLLRYDHVELVTTVIHELSHNHLYVPGQVRFNESFATFVGRVGAIRFFCTREGGGPDTTWCLRAKERWEDEMLFSVFLDGLVDELVALYDSEEIPPEEKVLRREEVFGRHQERFRVEVQPRFQSRTFQGFITTPLNNATLLARMRYYHRLPGFQALLEEHQGDLVAAVQHFATHAPAAEDPFSLLPLGGGNDAPPG